MHVFSKGCDERAYLISLAIHMQNIFVFRYFPQNLRFFRSHVYQVSHKLTFPLPKTRVNLNHFMVCNFANARVTDCPVLSADRCPLVKAGDSPFN